MADLPYPPTPPRRPSRLTESYSPRPLIAVMGLGALLPMSAVTFVLLLPQMQDAYHQGLSILGLVAVQQVQTGLGPDFILALVANRTSRTRVLVGAGGFFTAAAAVLWLAGVFPNQILLYAGAIGVVLGGGALTSTQNSLLCDYYPVSLRPRVILAQRAALVFGLTLCPLMVGVLAYLFGWQASFFVLAAGAFVFVVLAARLPDPVPAGGLPEGDPDRPEPPVEPATVPEAARVIATTRSLRLIYYSLPFLLGTILGITFYATAYYEDIFHQDAAHRALLFGLAEPGAIIGLLIGLVVLPRRIAAEPGKAMRTIAWLAVAAAAGAACLALAPDVIVAFAAQLVFAGASAVVIGGVYAMLSVALPTRMLTVGFGLSTVWLTFGALLIGPPNGVPTINSLITNAFGYRASFWIFVPLFVIGASLLRSASRFVAQDIAKRKITEAADAAVRQERADGTGRLLMVRSLDAGYDGVQVVFGVDLDVGDGEMVAVLGTNGAGKSTLMRAISGLVVPTAGEVMFDGTAITTYEAYRITEAGILQVPGGRGIFPGLTVGECLRVAGWLYDTDDEDLARATETVLGYFPVLSRRWHTPAGSLSGGEQQMLSLSMAFIAKPKLLIIDELSLGLAPTVIESLLGIVQGIHDGGTAIILVEQSINLALRLCDRAIFMEKGQVVFSGRTADLLDRQDIVRSVLLGGATDSPTDLTRAVADRADLALPLDAALDAQPRRVVGPGPLPALWRGGGGRWRRPRPLPGRDPGPARAERCREDHHLRIALGRAALRGRPDHHGRRRHHVLARLSKSEARARPLLPGRPAVAGPHRARVRHHGDLSPRLFAWGGGRLVVPAHRAPIRTPPAPSRRRDPRASRADAIRGSTDLRSVDGCATPSGVGGDHRHGPEHRPARRAVRRPGPGGDRSHGPGPARNQAPPRLFDDSH